MATKELKLSIESRTSVGTTGSHALRAAGKIPAVLYGHGDTPRHLAVDAHAFDELLHHGGRNAIVTLEEIGGKAETVLLREVQRHPISRKVIHTDFQRVSATEAVHAKLRVVTVGVARGVRDAGAVMDVVIHELEIEGPANAIPEYLEIDVTELELHGHVTAGDVKLPDGFKMLTPAETLVVAIEPSKTAQDLEAAEAGPTLVAEPEVIGAKPEAPLP